MQRTAKLVKKLRPLIETESLLTFFLEPLVEVEPGVTNPSSKRLEAAEWLERCVVAALAKIELNAAFLVKNEKELRRWRLEPDEPSKSAERRFIWERFLKFWSDLGRPVGYSEDGPIIRALRIIHESLEIPAPKG